MSSRPLVPWPSSRWVYGLTATPFLLTVVFAALLACKPTRHFAVTLTDENHPVELLTFLFLLIAAVQSCVLARSLGRSGGRMIWRVFYVLFGGLLFLTAMEEISWGQWFFHFRTPESISRINTQHEFNLHNLKGMGGHTEFLRLGFGVGGFIGIALSRWPVFGPVAAPARVLWAWFAVITALSAADLFCDYREIDTPVAKALDVMSEVVELMIAASAVLYLWMKGCAPREARTGEQFGTANQENP
jgi:hypothetical protein